MYILYEYLPISAGSLIDLLFTFRSSGFGPLEKQVENLVKSF